MSERYPGGFITKDTPVTTQSSATGVWTLDQALQATRGGNWPVNGPFYIEDVFSTWLYTGNGGTQTITNGINFSGKGGLLWLKARSTTGEHALFDTLRGTGTLLNTDSTNQARSETGLASFNTDGFSFAGAGSTVAINFNGRTFASWSFREQPKFFDVVTWTGTGSAQTISHNLGSVPGCIIVKRTSGTQNWIVYHRSLSTDQNYLQLNLTDAQDNSGQSWNVTSTTFNANSNVGLNASGATYVAYLFAHNAGGFGLSGNDNVITCGSYVGNGSTDGPTVTLGYEPQWILVKNATGAADWWIVDSMRGMPVGSNDWRLRPNTSAEDNNGDPFFAPTATGFKLETLSSNVNTSGSTYIYIAIRRGPMKTPTTGTSVFAPVTYTGDGSTTTGQLITTGFPVDMGINRYNRGGAGDWDVVDRLRGITGATYTTSPQSPYLNPHNTNAEALGGYIFAATNTTIRNYGFSSSFVQANYLFQRAPGFFDEVCYTGTGVRPLQLNHNLGAVPELMIVKRRNLAGSGSSNWFVYSSATGNTSYLQLNTTAALASSVSAWNNTTPTSTTFTVGDFDDVNGSTGFNYVAYLFASAPGVSKVGSYTGTGTTQTINCGFTGGARFVMIKRTDSTGDWFVWDTARGMIPANDPYLRLNSTAAEVTGTDFVDTAATGFEITSTAPAAINASGGTFIYLAIA